jgi:hypothetical protein
LQKGESALILATQKASEATIKLLIAAGIDAQAQNEVSD